MRAPGASALLVALAVAAAQPNEPVASAPVDGATLPTVTVAVEPLEATVGDRLALLVEVTVPAGTRFDVPQIGPSLGPFAVLDGSWGAPQSVGQGQRWSWSGSIVTFRTGEAQLPAVRVVLEDDAGGRQEVTSEPLAISIRSILDESGEQAEAEGEIADLKPPASLPPDHRALLAAAGILALLLSGAGLLWWLNRRYAARLARVPAPDDPFHRTPPHEWVYAELQKLLERRLPEQGQITLFYEELARIVKRYLGGRYRVDLLERTTEELRPALRAAGADPQAVDVVRQLLARCDLVKFARAAPDATAWRAAIEDAYRVVDATKPRSAPDSGALEGAA